MNSTIEVLNRTKCEKIKKKLYKLNLMYLKSKEKVAYYYEDVNTGTIFSYNPNITFYAASAIKILPVLYLYMKEEDNLSKELLITTSEIKGGSGVIKDYGENKYSLKDLIRYSIVYSDNTAHVKLVNYITKEKLREFGISLGAKYTMESKETDTFGIINCSYMIIYWKEIIKYIENGKYGSDLKNHLLNPTFRIIKKENLDNNDFMCKYGSFGVAYHEIGFVNDKNPYYLAILTQKNEKKEKDYFINKTARELTNIHKMVSKVEEK